MGASLAASLQTAWYESGMFILVTHEKLDKIVESRSYPKRGFLFS
jgi:hypothetical protein